MSVYAASPDAQAQLLEAIRTRNVAAAQAAIEAGADVNLAGDFARTPLHDAARESAEITSLLLAHGARPNTLDGDGRTPLHLAHVDSAQVLLDHKADFLILDKNGNSVLHTAAEQSASMCKLLVDAGLTVIDARSHAGLTPLHFAALQARQDAAEYLLSRGADINAKTLTPYSYKWTYVAWDARGMEETVPAGATVLSIALRGHEQTKWSSGRGRKLVELLRSHGAQEPRNPPRMLYLLASPIAFVAFFWVLFHVDAYLRDWSPLAARFTATIEPSDLESHQNGSVGRVGTIQLRKMLRTAVTLEGLYIAMPAWVIAAHPPLHIPWTALRIESCSRGLTGTHLQLRVTEPGVPILLSGGVADRVLNRLDPNHNCKGET